MKRPRLRAVSALPEYRLELTFTDGSRYVVSLARDVERLPGLLPLRDPEAFGGARVIEGEGWTVEWETFDIQVGADTLLLEALAQATTDDNTRTFLSWRARNGLSLAEAGRALGLTPRTISAYGTGGRRVPRYIALACKGWEAERAR
jgi:hypothetical protein